MDQSLEMLKNFLSTYPKEITDHMAVVKNDNQYPMLHISNQRDLLRFVPRIGFSQIKTEDRTIPRVCVARTLAGCTLSYQRCVTDTLHYYPDGKNTPAHYYIKRFEYDYTIVPKKELVCDVDRTGEEWLVAYSPDTSCYIARNTGEVFVKNIEVHNISSSAPEVHGVFGMAISEPLSLDGKTMLPPGCYEFVLTPLYGGDYRTAVISCKTISRDEYNLSRLSTSSAKIGSFDW